MGAYALITRDEHLLLTHWNPRRPDFEGAWTLPAAAWNRGEQPEGDHGAGGLEETGFHVASDGLVGVHSYWMSAEQRLDPPRAATTRAACSAPRTSPAVDLAVERRTAPRTTPPRYRSRSSAR
ncbi:hypothetical protein QJS66_21170 [Kocuria rhizophila]|nr:hypothetical protein QJS66_21170 [Kocuria rhizophila]